MEIKEKVFKFIDFVYDKYFSRFDIDIIKIKQQIDIDIGFMVERRYEENGIRALVFYRLTRASIAKLNNEEITGFVFEIRNISKLYSNSYISPFSNIECPVFIGSDVFIDRNYSIRNNVVIENKCQLFDNNYIYNDTKQNIIDYDVELMDNVKIHCSSVGANTKICCNCIIREDIAADVVVEVVNELQIKKSTKNSRIPSQELRVYGIVPKYKNSFVLYGEGIYNPKVKLVVQNHTPSCEILYWDKNKIIVRIGYFIMGKSDKSKLIIFSNGQRIVINNSIGLQNTLKNLKK